MNKAVISHYQIIIIVSLQKMETYVQRACFHLVVFTQINCLITKIKSVPQHFSSHKKDTVLNLTLDNAASLPFNLEKSYK